MAAALRHRGPDEFGIYRDAHCGLAHARLSIIDLVTGQQPLTNEDDSLWISFNGEIFNYLELREELFALGHFFRTRSDTEVIVHSFEQWGEECFARFNGQFAIALWDERLSTVAVERELIGMDMSRARRAEVIDEHAAIFILQGALDRLTKLRETR